MEDIDPYKVLGVTGDATLEEIKASYKNLIKHYHPDRVVTFPQEFRDLAHEKMVELNIAYEMITHPERFEKSNRIRAKKPPQKKGEIIRRCPFCGAKNRIPPGTDMSMVKCGKCKRAFKDINFKSYQEKFYQAYEKKEGEKKKKDEKDPLYSDYEEWKKKKGIHIEKAEKKFLGILDFGDPLVWVGILFCLFILIVQLGAITGIFSPGSRIFSLSKTFIIIVVTGSAGFLMLFFIDQYLKIEALKKFGFGKEVKDSLNELICNKCGGLMRKSNRIRFTIPGIILLFIIVMVFLLTMIFIFKQTELVIIFTIITVPVIIFLVFISATTKRLWVCGKCGDKITRTR
ncbi:DnaJ domain-containing protein [bacterium]|nr:DnaJ domain-containing protein [bacterium]